MRYERDAGLLTRLPGVPSGIKGTLRGVREIREGWATPAARRRLWATWAAKSVPDLVAAAPAFLVMDMTPVQMEAMGALYGYSRARARLGGGWKRRATERLYRQAAHLFPWNDWVAASLRDDYGVPAGKDHAGLAGRGPGLVPARPVGPARTTASCACCSSAATSRARAATCCCAGRARRRWPRPGNCTW